MVGEGGDPRWPAALPVDPSLPDRFPPYLSVSVPAAPYPHDHLQGFVPSAAAAPVPFPCPEHLRGFVSSRGRIVWTEEGNKIFEAALLEFFEAGEEERTRAIAARLPGKTWEDVREHYQRLERDLRDIEAGVIPLPEYADKYWCHPSAGEGSSGGNTGKAKSGQRRKGIPWSEEEHSRFLTGLEKYEMGQWREISRFARGDDQDAGSGGQPRPEVLPPAEQEGQEGPAGEQHPRASPEEEEEEEEEGSAFFWIIALSLQLAFVVDPLIILICS